MRRAHLIIGLLGVVAFLGSGLYMHYKYQHFQVPEVYGSNEVLRFMFRANHIYLLMASLVNLTMAVYFREATHAYARWICRIGSALVLASPILLGVAFFVEVPEATLDRTLTYYGVVALAAGVVAHTIIGGRK